MRETLRAWLEATFGVAVPGWIVPGQTELVALGFLASGVLAVILGRRRGIPLRPLVIGLVTAFVAALVGSRFFAVAFKPGLWLSDPMALIALHRAGSASFGALLGGCIGYAAYARVAKQDLWRHADAIVPAAGVGLASARTGCFVHGCDYGRVTELPWGVRYPIETPPFVAQEEHGFVGGYQVESLPVIPFQMILGTFDLVVAAVFIAWPKLALGEVSGRRALTVGGVYFGGRFFIEFLRSPWSAPMIGFLNLAQWLCLGSLVVLAALYRLRITANTTSAPTTEPQGT